MKGPGIKDYLNALEIKKQEAIASGQAYIELSSKQLHAEISPMHATMPTCCQAIYKMMLEGDMILKRPKGNTGFGSHLHVRFYVNDLNRNRMFPDKKRGRPAKSEEEKLANRKAKLKRSTADLISLITEWLIKEGWNISEDKENITAKKTDCEWIINVHGIKRGRKQTLPMKITEVLKNIQNTNVRYSIAFNDSLSYRRQWSEIPNAVKIGLNMSMILADKKGNIIEI